MFMRQRPVASAGVGNRRMFFFLLLLSVASTAGLQGWQILISNFAVDRAGYTGFENGLTQSVREIPGFLSLLVVYLLLIVREHRLAALSVLLLGAGVAATGFLPSLGGILLTTLIMSFGFHYYQTLNMSLILQNFDLAEAPLVSGRLRGAEAASNLGVAGVIFVLAGFLDYTWLFLALGGVVAAAGAAGLFRDPKSQDALPQHKHMVVRRKYALFYGLTFLAGARRQIFVAFAVFLLVKKFDYTLQAVTVLFLANNLVNTVLAPYVGKAVNRFGERAVLTLEYGSLALVFTGYALVQSPWLAAGLYILDNVFFNFALAIQTYFQKIADPRDIAPSMAVGFTINHVAAVVIPVAGGLLWTLDYRVVFLAGAFLALCSLLLTRLIPSRA